MLSHAPPSLSVITLSQYVPPSSPTVPTGPCSPQSLCWLFHPENGRVCSLPVGSIPLPFPEPTLALEQQRLLQRGLPGSTRPHRPQSGDRGPELRSPPGPAQRTPQPQLPRAGARPPPRGPRDQDGARTGARDFQRCPGRAGADAPLASAPRPPLERAHQASAQLHP